jgi:hypothetical protein
MSERPAGNPPLAGRDIKASHVGTEVTTVATVKQQSGGEYQVTVSESELTLIKNALDEAERVARFGMEVLDEVDPDRDAEPPVDSRLRQEIEGLAMREASLRSLQKTMSEVDRGSTPPPMRQLDLDQLRSAARVPAQRLR